MAQNQKLRTTLTDTQAQLAALQNEVRNHRAALINQTKYLKAIIALLGEDSVKVEVERMEAEEQRQAEAQQAEGVKAMVEAGILVPVAVSGVKSFIVGTDNFDAVEGRPTPRSQRVQFEVAQIRPELQSNYLGKKVGDVIPADGGKFTINEVYDIDVVKAVENAKKAAQAQAVVEPAPALAAPAAPEAPTEAPAAPEAPQA
jgi:hypothetical protein